MNNANSKKNPNFSFFGNKPKFLGTSKILRSVFLLFLSSISRSVV